MYTMIKRMHNQKPLFVLQHMLQEDITGLSNSFQSKKGIIDMQNQCNKIYGDYTLSIFTCLMSKFPEK